MKLPFNQGNRKTQLLVSLIILLMLAALATAARAGESYASFGVGTSIVRGQAEMLSLDLTFPQAGPKDADFRTGIVLIGASEFRKNPEPSQAAGYVELVDGFKKCDVGVGVAYLQNTDEYNGSNANFTLSLACRYKALRATLRHFSNAGTKMPNRGRDMLYISYAF